MRIFLGLIPTLASRAWILQAYPLALPNGTRYIPPDQLHLTLLFIGDYPEKDVPQLCTRLEAILNGERAYQLTPHSLHWVHRTLWVVLEEDLRLRALADRLHEAVGLPNPKSFRPHITIARARRPIQQLSLRMPAPQPLAFAEAHLFRSILKPDGATYESLARYSLDVRLS